MTVEPHTASVKLMQIQSDTQGHQESVESQFRYEDRSAQELLAVACWRRLWVGEIGDPNPLLLLWAPASRLLLA